MSDSTTPQPATAPPPAPTTSAPRKRGRPRKTTSVTDAIKQIDALKATLERAQAASAPDLVGHDPLVRIEARLARIEASLKTLVRYLADEASSIGQFPDANLGVQ